MTAAVRPVADRIDALDWDAITAGLDELGVAAIGPILTPDECALVAGWFEDPTRFRATVDMARHRFGRGTYRYFSCPLPPLVAELRTAAWPHVVAVAREWAARWGRAAPWPDDHADFIAQCRAAGQTRPTPLLLRYEPGDWNALHRDLYGEVVFPLQLVVGLDRPGDDYEGGEFVVVEQRFRAQSRPTVMAIPAGHGLVFTTSERPVRTGRGWAAAPMRHGVSVLRRGRRHTLGIPFHDAT